MAKKTVFLLLGIFLICCCCSSNSEEPSIDEPTDQEGSNQNQELSFLALGDSYTIGQGVDPNDSWPFQLKTAFNSSKNKIEELTIIARTGWTTSNLLNAIEEQAPTNHDLVSLLIGVNNQYQRGSFSKFQAEFNTLLNIATNLAGNNKRVIVISIPDYGVTPFGSNNSEIIAQELNNYNAYIKQRCIATETVFIDVTSISRELGASENALADDKLHPSGFQYNLWVEKMLPVVNEVLK